MLQTDIALLKNEELIPIKVIRTLPKEACDNTNLYTLFAEVVRDSMTLCALHGISFELHTDTTYEEQFRWLYHYLRLSIRFGGPSFDIVQAAHVVSEVMKECAQDDYTTLVKWFLDAGYDVWKIETPRCIKESAQKCNKFCAPFFFVVEWNKDTKGNFYYHHIVDGAFVNETIHL